MSVGASQRKTQYVKIQGGSSMPQKQKGRPDESRRPTKAALQLVNPKSWLMALTVSTVFATSAAALRLAAAPFLFQDCEGSGLGGTLPSTLPAEKMRQQARLRSAPASKRIYPFVLEADVA
jgi:hypothetical protein